jgi:chemotaxis protein MotB
MARKKKQAGGGENTEGWLTTYADLISLLLCFFVLMYAASTPDEAKMQWILQAMTPIRGEIVNPIIAEEEPIVDSEGGTNENQTPPLDNNPDGDIHGVPGDLPLTFDDLFNWVSVAIESNNLDASVDAYPGKMHIRFDSDVMFAPDSADLLPAGRNALNRIAPGIAAVNAFIANASIEGHTAPNSEGGLRHFRDQALSTERANSVYYHLAFGRTNPMVDIDKYKTVGHGPFAPHYMPLTNESQNARNRRVELVITRNDYNPEGTAVMVDMLKYDYHLPTLPGGPQDGRDPDPGVFNRHQEIMQRIRDRYGLDEPSGNGSGNGQSEFGPAIPGLPPIPSGDVNGAD